MICAQVGALWLLGLETNLIKRMKGKPGQLQLNQHIQSIPLLMCFLFLSFFVQKLFIVP